MLRIIITDWEEHRFDQLIEFMAAVILALATIGTAWCGYQAARWGGEQQTKFVEATAAYLDAAKLSNRAVQINALHVDLFVEWVSAVSSGDEPLADFLYQRFPPEMKTAFDAWLALDPMQNPNAPSSPFALPEYRLPEYQEADTMAEQADEFFEQAARANATADKYVLLTVIFASVLFFGGISGKFKTRLVDLAMLLLAFILFVAGLILLLALPVQ